MDSFIAYILLTFKPSNTMNRKYKFKIELKSRWREWKVYSRVEKRKESKGTGKTGDVERFEHT